MALSDARVRSPRPGTKPQKMADGDGLYLLLQPNGSKLWRFNYRYDGKQKTLAFGKYPDVGLKDARDLREVARR